MSIPSEITTNPINPNLPNSEEKEKSFKPLHVAQKCDEVQGGSKETPPQVFKFNRHLIPPPLSKRNEQHIYRYLPEDEIETVGIISKEIYQEVVENVPVCRVDVFLYNPIKRTYLLVLRKDPPAQGVWWLPGGRLYKGESFDACSIRKCKEEVGLDVTPKNFLGFAATLFPDSAWNAQTHTINILVLAEVSNAKKKVKIDKTCENYQWKSLDYIPEDPYVFDVYQKALAFLNIKINL